MEVAYTVRFKPDARVDYSYNLVVLTEREKFLVPLHARGGTPLLDLPDTVDFATCPVKYETEKTILVRNVGDKPTKFLIKTSAPFSTSIRDGYLDVQGAVQVPQFLVVDALCISRVITHLVTEWMPPSTRSVQFISEAE